MLDPYNTGPAKEIKWVSPSGSWRNFALGDTDNNQDLEIVAIRGSEARPRRPSGRSSTLS